jgi:hypothetical protein
VSPLFFASLISCRYGRSLGSGPSTYLAHKLTQQGIHIGGLILQSPLLSIYRVAFNFRFTLPGDLFPNIDRSVCCLLFVHSTLSSPFHPLLSYPSLMSHLGSSESLRSPVLFTSFMELETKWFLSGMVKISSLPRHCAGEQSLFGSMVQGTTTSRLSCGSPPHFSPRLHLFLPLLLISIIHRQR